MSSKSAKRSAAHSSSSSASSSTSTPQVPSSTSSVQSPMTPTRLSRIQEKNTLAGLNDRLAAYIERNQQLEYENQSYSKQINQYEENMSKSIVRVKADYEKEVMSLRKLVDETAKDKNKLENDTTSLKKDFDDLKSKFDKISKDHSATQKLLTQKENAFTDLTAANSRATTERDKLLAEKKDFEGEIARLSREVAELRNRLEQESLAKVEAENQLRNRNEQLTFNKQLHEKEIHEVRSRRQIEIQEVDGRLQQEYETKLQQSIQELRQEYEAQLRANKDEMDNLYDQKYADMKAQLKRLQNSAQTKGEEISALQSRLESAIQNAAKYEQELAKSANVWTQEKNEFLRRIKELEKKSDDDHSRFANMLDARDAEIDNLQHEKANLMSDYQDLMDTKVALDNEIAMYRKLLESEEKRLDISPRGPKRGATPAGGARATPLRGIKKRRYEEELVDIEAAYDSESHANGDIEISQDDAEGKYVKLTNKGDKEVSLSGWTLTRRAGELEVTHKFYRQMKLEPNASVTVWSSDAPGAVHEPPHNLIMKGQKWFPNDSLHTVLHNNANEEMAVRTTKRIHVSKQRKRLGFGSPEDLFHQEADGAQADRCVIC